MNTNLYEKVVNENGEEIYKPYDITKTTICGRTLQEIMDILGALDLEKEYDLKMTMKNLKQWQEMMYKEQQKEFDKQLYNIRIKEYLEEK